MNIDTLITIAVIIYIIYSIKKAISAGKQKDGQPKPKASGWMQKIQDVVNEVREEIEKANRQQHEQVEKTASGTSSADDSFWGDLIGDDTDEDISVSETSNMVLNIETVPPELPDIPEDSEPSHRNHPEQISTPDLQPVRCRTKRIVSAGKMSKNDLKKAIIWSEILNKPLALRD